ncbi:fibronectin type III domain-containing protein [Dyadobacter sp. CY323]|uniref:fibronectin type III domain-containing protein n=1 Tax=Dyadobacter sp. CY323 TaxID=2907302 RepID=UPI001F37D48F|nr:fibronectin type III domain-containing protein [Dyadobacter sp. CY323]MCE6988556.1 fibronectin type III domain-containing protein [Dyadobacter sp. CY323]
MKNRTFFHTILLFVLCIGNVLLFPKTGLAQRPMLRANVVSYKQVDLSWDRLPASVEVFIVERKEDGPGQNFAAISGNLSGTTFSYQDKTVQENRNYIYRVQATCDKSCGGTLNEVRVTTPSAPPANPSNLEAFYISGRGMAITWQGNNSDGTTFLLERSDNGGGFNLLTRVPYSRSLSYNDGTTTAGNSYCYRVKAVGAGGESGYSNEGCVSRSVPKPTAPSGLSANVANARQINLSWTDNATNETGFEIERSENGTNFSKIGDAGENATSYQDNGVNPKTKYWYRVLAKNGGGTSDYSNVADATTPDVAPNAPQRLSAQPVSNTQIDLTWADISGNETGFELQRSLDGNAFSKLADLPENATSYSNTGLSTLTKYWYRILAKNAIGSSGFSNVAEATTFDVPPGAPANLTAQTVSSSQINLTWKDQATNEAKFELERSTDGTSFSKITDINANTTTYENTGLQPATKYWYRVRSVNGSGPSIFSNIADATTLDVVPNAPARLSATTVNYEQINLAWEDVSGNETGFQIERSTNGTTFNKIADLGANVKTYESKGLNAETKYYFRIRAVNAIGNSPYSNVADATTAKAPIPDAPTNLTAVPVDFDLIQLRWSKLSANATEVIIERSTKPNADFKQIGRQAASVIQFADREILDVADYYYRIKAINAAGSSGYSNVAPIFAASIITAVEPVGRQESIYCVNRTLVIELPRAANIRVNLCNIRGQKQMDFQTSGSCQTDLSGLSAGIYIVVIETEKKIIKQKIALF